MARSQEAARIPAPSLTAGDRLDARASRHGGAPRKAGNSYRRLTCDDHYHILRLARGRDPARTQGSRRMAVSRPSPAVPDDRQTAKPRPKRKFLAVRGSLLSPARERAAPHGIDTCLCANKLRLEPGTIDHTSFATLDTSTSPLSFAFSLRTTSHRGHAPTEAVPTGRRPGATANIVAKAATAKKLRNSARPGR